MASRRAAWSTWCARRPTAHGQPGAALGGGVVPALKVGTPGEATSPHLALEELKRLAGWISHFPFKGWGESSTALLGAAAACDRRLPGRAQPEQVRAFLWEQYRTHSDVLRRLGMLRD